jgi:hypothetical protein
VPSPAISDLRTTLSRRRHLIRIQTAEVDAVKRLLRAAARNSGRRGSLRTGRACSPPISPPNNSRSTCAITMPVWSQAAERVRALDLSLGDSARERRDAVKRLETVPGVVRSLR